MYRVQKNEKCVGRRLYDKVKSKLENAENKCKFSIVVVKRIRMI